MQEEKALVVVCQLYARQGTPLTIIDFIQLANHVAKKKEGKSFSRHFVDDFVERYSSVLCKKKGKLTSPKRCYEAMKEKTYEFIESMNSIMRTNTINKNNMVVFDETVLGDSLTLPLYIGEQKDSGGGSTNVCRIREKRLGTYIPFSLPDGTTPFRVFIVKDDEMVDDDSMMVTFAPGWEKGLRGDPHRLFLRSQSGFLNTELFAYIMQEFTKWWTLRNPGLHCFLICDNLSMHRNDSIVKTALASGIHMIYIMPGSSGWFQVHDQHPFGILKKEMANIRDRKVPLIPLEASTRKAIRTGVFYEAEEIAFQPHVVRAAFANVGLSPWNPSRILVALETHARTIADVEQDKAYYTLSDSVKVCAEKKLEDCCQLLKGLKPVRAKSVPKVEKRNVQNGAPTPACADDDLSCSAPADENCEGSSIESPAKRMRKMSLEPKQCSATGCQKTHFWSKKWHFCLKCKKNFCPIHEEAFRQHKC